MSRNNYLAEAFKSMRSDDILNEEAFTLDSKGADELKQFLDGDDIDDTISVIDPDAETPEELEDSYIGKVILDCCVCHSKLYKDKDEVVIDEDGDLANVDEECPFCYCVDGFKIVGEVKEFNKDDSNEDGKGEKDDEPKPEEKDEVEVEETDEDDKIEESVSEKRSARMKKKVCEGNATSFAKNLIDIAKEARTMAVLEPDKSPDEILDSVIEGIEEPIDAIKYYYGNSAKSIIEFLKGVGIYDRLKKQLKSSVTELLKTNKLVPDEVATKWDAETDESLKEGNGCDDLETAVEDCFWEISDEGIKPSKSEVCSRVVDDCGADRKEVRAVVNKLWGKLTSGYNDDMVANGAETINHKPFDTESLKEGKKLREAPNYELHPQYDSRKSFYGKARVDTGDKDDKNKLYSYDTLVAEIKDGKPVVYGAFSATTLRHIKDWLKQNGFKAENKAQILRDYGVKAEAKECNGKKCRKHDIKRIEEGWRGSDEIEVVSHGEWADPDLVYKDYTFNYWDIEDALWDNFLEETGHKDSESEDPKVEAEFDKYVQDNAVGYLEDCIAFGYFKDDKKSWRKDECKESVTESVEEVSVKTDKEDISVRTDEEGKVSVETSVREETDEGAEEIAPVSDEVKSEIEDGSEEAEIGDEIDVEMTDFDEESFDELGEAYLKKAYSNVESYKSVSATANDNRITVEGVIKFKSGNEKKTKFVLESKEVTKSGKSRFVGENLQIAKGKKAFTVFGTLSEGRFVTESLGYDYRAKDKNGKSKRISGTVTKR